MREATKSFTNFTNKWKRLPQNREQIYRTSRNMGISEIREEVKTYDMTHDRKVVGAVKFVPSLPVPKAPERGARISFLKPRADVRRLGQYLFDNPDVEPRVVGEEAFDRLLRSARM